jgi:hypothetical protein
VTKIESVLFSADGCKGLLERLEEFMQEFWNYTETKRKESCFYLNDQKRSEVVETTKKERRKMSWQGVGVLLSTVSTVAAMLTLMLKLFKVF